MTDLATTAVILAAGKGTRLKSALPKVLHQVAGRPMLGHVLASVQALPNARAILVIGPDMEPVAEYARTLAPDLKTAIQKNQKGTGDAVRAALGQIPEGAEGTVLVVFGDTPLIRPETLLALRAGCADGGAAVTVLGFRAQDPAGYGRLVLDKAGRLERIVETKDAKGSEIDIDLCNGGAMAIDASQVHALVSQISDKNAQKEFYLTDVVAIANARGLSCSVHIGSEDEVFGVNSRSELANAEALCQQRLRDAAMAAGVTLRAPETVFLSADTKLGRDVIIEPNVFVGPGVSIGDETVIKSFSHLEGASVGKRAEIGPFARLRPGTVIGDKARIGNFVEVKKSAIESGAKVNHLAYIGDARVGTGANIGAGTITCNYDGFGKYFTDIGAGAFIGSNSSLVAPVKIADGAYVGSGSVITKDVSEDALAVARGRQFEKPGWAKEFRTKQSALKQKKTSE